MGDPVGRKLATHSMNVRKLPPFRVRGVKRWTSPSSPSLWSRGLWGALQTFSILLGFINYFYWNATRRGHCTVAQLTGVQLAGFPQHANTVCPGPAQEVPRLSGTPSSHCHTSGCGRPPDGPLTLPIKTSTFEIGVMEFYDMYSLCVCGFFFSLNVMLKGHLFTWIKSKLYINRTPESF